MNQPLSIVPNEQLPAAMTAVTPMAMLGQAVANGASIEVLTKLMELSERWEANVARKAYDEAMAAAKAEIPVIIKNRAVDFTSQKGRTNYKYEDLGEIAKTVAPILSKHGLSYRFRVTSIVNEPVSVTCVITHKAGHIDDSNTLQAGRDESGNKNSIQAIGSTLTYLQRMTLKAALGLAVSNDDDGKASGAGDTITKEQIETIKELTADYDSETLFGLLNFIPAESIEAITAANYGRAIYAIGIKKGQTK
jgi:hypothetical protein